MLKTIEQSVVLGAPPREVFRTYLSAREHAAMTGQPVKIGARAGTPFSAFNGMIGGENLLIVPDRMIVQRWRSNGWKKTDLDSTLVLTFEPHPRGTRIHLVHVNVPAHDFKGVTEGWEKYYWKPWRAYLKRRRAK